MIREVIISFEVDSLLDDNDLCCAMDNTIEIGLDRAIEDKKISNYNFPSKNVAVHKIQPASKPDIGTKEPPKLLTDHAKYCRLSKQPGGLCCCTDSPNYCKPTTNSLYLIFDSFEDCMFPSKQQPVELPKDPLKELICGYTEIVYDNYVDEAFTQSDVEKTLREFAEKVSAVNDNINPVNDNIIQSNDICDYCATVYGSITCRACQPVNGHSGFQGKTVRTL